MKPDDPAVQRILEAMFGSPTDTPASMQEKLSEIAQQQFEETGDPYAAWSLLTWCVDNERDFPDWLIAYLRDASGKIHDLVHEKGGAKREAERVGRVLGFGAAGKGKAGRASAGFRAARDFEMAMRVIVQVIHDGKKPYIAAEEIGEEFNVDPSLVMKAYAAYKAEAFSTFENFINASDVTLTSNQKEAFVRFAQEMRIS